MPTSECVCARANCGRKEFCGCRALTRRKCMKCNIKNKRKYSSGEAREKKRLFLIASVRRTQCILYWHLITVPEKNGLCADSIKLFVRRSSNSRSAVWLSSICLFYNFPSLYLSMSIICCLRFIKGLGLPTSSANHSIMLWSNSSSVLHTDKRTQKQIFCRQSIVNWSYDCTLRFKCRWIEIKKTRLSVWKRTERNFVSH